MATLGGVGATLAHLTFTHTLFPSTWDGINGSFWSLGLEAQFYLLLPLLVLFFRRWGARALAIPLVVSVVWNVCLRVAFGPDSRFIVSHFLWGTVAPGRWLEFGTGMVAAWAVVTRRTMLSRFTPWLGAAGGAAVLLGVVFFSQLNSWPLVDSILLGAGTAALLAQVSLGGALSRAFAWTPLTRLGLVSYSCYLVHQPTEYYLSQFLNDHGTPPTGVFLAEMTAGLALVVLLASASFVLFERRYLVKRARRWRTESGLVLSADH